MKGLAAGAVITGVMALAGFTVGFLIGQSTRKAAASNVKTEYSDGKVIIEADVKSAIKTGVSDFITGITG